MWKLLTQAQGNNGDIMGECIHPNRVKKVAKPSSDH